MLHITLVVTCMRLQDGDELVAINQQRVDKMPLSDVMKLIIGPTGSAIQLLILREDIDVDGNVIDDVGIQFEVTLKRRPVDNTVPRRPSVSLTELDAYRRGNFRQSNDEQAAAEAVSASQDLSTALNYNLMTEQRSSTDRAEPLTLAGHGAFL
jgi:hypothetical protein